MAQNDLETAANGDSAFAELTATFRRIGVEFLVRNGNSGSRYVFVAPRQSLTMIASSLSVEDASLDSLCMHNRYFEFDEDGSLASY